MAASSWSADGTGIRLRRCHCATGENIMRSDAKIGDAGHVWDLIENIHMALLVTRDGEKVDARPMAASVRRKDHRIYILANAGEDSDRQIQADSSVVLYFQGGSSTYVVLHGTANSSDDRAKIAELWTAFDKAWWDSPDDPRIRLISIAPQEAEYWEGSGKIVAYAKMLAAAATGTRPNTGEHGSARL
jgi:general stress protein 26